MGHWLWYRRFNQFNEIKFNCVFVLILATMDKNLKVILENFRLLCSKKTRTAMYHFEKYSGRQMMFDGRNCRIQNKISISPPLVLILYMYTLYRNAERTHIQTTHASVNATPSHVIFTFVCELCRTFARSLIHAYIISQSASLWYIPASGSVNVRQSRWHE